MVSPDLKKEMLSLVDTNAFFESVCITAEVPRDTISREVVDKYLDEWAEAKAWLFELFEHKFELVQEVEVPSDKEVMRTNVEELCKKYPAYAATLKELRVEDFTEGVICETRSAFLRQIFPRVYRKGAKTSKVLSKILNDYNFDVELSKIFQNNMVKGRAIVSINPLDFVMLSTNTHKWGSCMSILYDKNDTTQNKGGFNKVGGFTLMRDEATVVAYLDHDKKSTFANDYGSFEWNDMVFRQLLTLDKDDLNNVVYGHYNGTPSDAIRDLWGKMVQNAVDGEGWEMRNGAPRNNQESTCYYDVYNYQWFGKKAPKARNMGTKFLHCVCCGKDFSDLHSNKNWLSCKNGCKKGTK